MLALGLWLVTAYAPGCGDSGRGTAHGYATGWGTIAAPYALETGAQLEVAGYGRGVVTDRGSAIQGRRLDVWLPTCSTARAWGVRWVNVRRLYHLQEG